GTGHELLTRLEQVHLDARIGQPHVLGRGRAAPPAADDDDAPARLWREVALDRRCATAERTAKGAAQEREAQPRARSADELSPRHLCHALCPPWVGEFVPEGCHRRAPPRGMATEGLLPEGWPPRGSSRTDGHRGARPRRMVSQDGRSDQTILAAGGDGSENAEAVSGGRVPARPGGGDRRRFP